jgi:hypothetical protein
MLRSKGNVSPPKSAGATKKASTAQHPTSVSPADEEPWAESATFSPWEWQQQQQGLRADDRANGNELVISDQGFSLLKPFSNLLCSIRRKVRANDNNMGNLQASFIKRRKARVLSWNFLVKCACQKLLIIPS